MYLILPFFNIGICLRVAIPLLLDVIVSSLAVIFYVAASIVSMKHVEDDHHLMYLTDEEEALHAFFTMSRHQVMRIRFRRSECYRLTN